MTAASALARGRRAAEKLMVDYGSVSRTGSSGTIDETTGKYGTATPTAVYDGRCRLQIRGMGSSTTPEAAGQDWVVQQTILQLPIDGSDGVRIGDLFVLVSSPNDPSREGRRFHISRRLSDKTHATKREFLLTEAGVAS